MLEKISSCLSDLQGTKTIWGASATQRDRFCPDRFVPFLTKLGGGGGGQRDRERDRERCQGFM